MVWGVVKVFGMWGDESQLFFFLPITEVLDKVYAFSLVC